MEPSDKKTTIIGLGTMKNGKPDPYKDAEVSEKATLVERKRRVSIQTAVRLRLFTLIISWVTVVVLGALGTTTLVISILTNSSSSFGFALSSLLDVMSSSVVIWRFANATKLYSASRERVACIVLGSLFIVSGVIVIGKSTFALLESEYPSKTNLVWYLSIVNGIACVFLASVKIYLAKKLESTAIGTDAINSAIGATLAFSTLISDLIYQQHRHVWYLDATFGIICAFFLIFYGIWLVIYECHYNNHTCKEAVPEED